MVLYLSIKHDKCSISEIRKPSFCYVRGTDTTLSGIMLYSFAIAITDVCDITTRRMHLRLTKRIIFNNIYCKTYCNMR